MTTPPVRHANFFLLDRSGSMADIREQTVASVNAYLTEMRDRPAPGLTFTLTRFDTEGIDTLHRAVPIADVPEFKLTDLEPRAGTPLIDALATTILKASAKYSNSDRVTIVTLTDGKENASKEFTLAELRALIAKHSAWDFTFLGASFDAYSEAGRFGIDAGSTMSYRAADRDASLAAYASVARRAKHYMSTGQKRDFARAEKQAAGDKYDPTA